MANAASIVPEAQWLEGGVFKAATAAILQNRLLVVCVIDESEEVKGAQRKQADRVMESVAGLLAEHCVCVRLAARSNEEQAFAQMFLAAYALSVCIIGKRGSALLSGPNVTAQWMEAEIQRMRQGRAVPVYTQSLAGLEVVEIERCRRVLVRRGQREAGRRRQVAADFREDRMAHQAVHGLPAEAPIVASNWAAAKVAEGRVRLLLRASNGRWKMAEFSADAPLAEVRAYAEKTLLLSPGRVELALALSRHVLPPSGDARSLAGLGLAPSATLLVSVRRAQLASLLLPVWCLWIAALFVLLAVIAAWLGYRLGGVFAGLW